MMGSMIERLDDQLFLVDGSSLVRDLNRLCGFAIPEAEVYATLRGFLMTQLQRQPRIAEAVELGSWRYTIAQVTDGCVVKIHVARLSQGGCGAARVNT